jgi:hypothetical protein
MDGSRRLCMTHRCMRETWGPSCRDPDGQTMPWLQCTLEHCLALPCLALPCFACVSRPVQVTVTVRVTVTVTATLTVA